MGSIDILKAFDIIRKRRGNIDDINLQSLNFLKHMINHTCSHLACSKCPIRNIELLKDDIGSGRWSCEKEGVREQIYEAMKVILKHKGEYSE